MLLRQITAGPLRTNSYLIADEKAREALLIDAGEGAAKEIEEAAKKDGLRVLFLINTHGHFDHVDENAEIKRRLGCKTAIHSLDAQATAADLLLKDGDILKAGSLSLRAIHSPGHTPGGICLFEEKQGLLFSGDTLFKGTYGRTDLQGGSDSQMLESLKTLASLPKSTKVFPGHGAQTSIGDEKWLPKPGAKDISELGVLF